MSADEYVWCSLFEDFLDPGIEVGRGAANVCHPDGESFTRPPLVFWKSGLHIGIIDVAVYGADRFLAFQGCDHRWVADIAGVPYFITCCSQRDYLRVQEGVCIGKEEDLHGCGPAAI